MLLIPQLLRVLAKNKGVCKEFDQGLSDVLPYADASFEPRNLVLHVSSYPRRSERKDPWQLGAVD
jgi:hypothetical protein